MIRVMTRSLHNTSKVGVAETRRIKRWIFRKVR